MVCRAAAREGDLLLGCRRDPVRSRRQHPPEVAAFDPAWRQTYCSLQRRKKGPNSPAQAKVSWSLRLGSRAMLAESGTDETKHASHAGPTLLAVSILQRTGCGSLGANSTLLPCRRQTVFRKVRIP